MRNFLVAAIIFPLATFCAAAPPATSTRTIQNTPGIPPEPLRTAVTPKFYQSLCRTNIAGWIGVRGRLVGNRLTGAKIVHSELGGAYDALALKLADAWEMKGSNPAIGTYLPYTAMCYLLIYQLKDGKMAVSFVNVDNPGGNQFFYEGPAYVAIEKNGNWKQITAPQK